MKPTMRRFLQFSLILTIIFLAHTATTHASVDPSFIRNGTFSSGLTSWNLNANIPYGWNPLSGGRVDLHPSSGYLGQVLYQNLNVTNIAGKSVSFYCTLTRNFALAGKTIAIYLEYIDASNNRQLLKLANPDNNTIGIDTVVTGGGTLPAGTQKVVRLSVYKEGDGDFQISNIAASATDVTTGEVPVITGISSSSGLIGSTLTISGTNFGASAGSLTLAGSSSGLTVGSWSDTSITATVQSSARSGVLRLVNGYVENDGVFPFQVTSPHLALMAMIPQQTVIKGQTAEFVIRGDFLNGFTSSPLTFSVTGPNNSASPFPNGSVLLTPATLKNSGGFSVRITTTGLTIGQTYDAEVRTTTASGVVSTPFSLTVAGVSIIKFYTSTYNPDTGLYDKSYITSVDISTQGSFSGIAAEAQDSNGQIFSSLHSTDPITYSSSNPTILGVYPIYFGSASFFALDNGTASLVATTPDGTSASLTVNISVPASPKVTNTSLYPFSITNKDVTTKPISVGATLEFGDASSYGFGYESSLISVDLGSASYDSTSKLFNGTLTVQPDTTDSEHPQPPNPGLVGVNVHLSGSPTTGEARQEVVLSVTNDPSYGLIKAGARSLDPAMSLNEPYISLDFYNTDATKLFNKYAFSGDMSYTSLASFGGLTPASYKLEYTPPFGDGTPVWYPNATDAASAEAVTVLASQENLVLIHYLPNTTFTVTMDGTGSGSVASTPTGMTCSGSSCSGSYPASSWITLHATPDTGSLFTGWSSACSGTADCTVTANNYATVTATFTAIRPTLTVGLSGSGTGSVTSSPSGISCPGTCSAEFDQNSDVTLAAAPSSSSSFGGWSGSCSGTAGCTVSMGTTDKSVTASFNASPKVKVGILGFDTLTLAYAGVTSDPVIMARDIEFVESLTLNRAIAVTLKGGLDANFASVVGGYTSLKGNLTVASGSLTIENAVIK